MASVAKSVADAREGEPEMGTLVFSTIGTVRIAPEDEAVTRSETPGHACKIAVSGRYGYFVVAYGARACCARTSEVAHAASEWKTNETAEDERVLDRDSIHACERSDGGGSIEVVSMTRDERAFATCDENGRVEFYIAKSENDGTVSAEKFGEMTMKAPVRALKWCSDNRSFVALVGDELLFVEGVGKEAKRVAGGVSCVSARSNDTLVWAIGNTVFLGSQADPLQPPKSQIEIGPFRGPEDTVEVDGIYAASAEKFLLTARSEAEPDDCFLSVLMKSEGSWTNTRLESAFDIDPEVVVLGGPVLNASSFSPWNIAFVTHRKAWDNQLLTIRVALDKPPCVLEVDDDRCFASVPMTVEDENNYVTGLGIDLTGAGGQMLNPQDKSAPELAKGPVLLFTTTDGRITLLKCANLNEDEGRVGAQSVQTPLTLPSDLHPAKADTTEPVKHPLASAPTSFGFGAATPTVASTSTFGFAPSASSTTASTHAFSFKPPDTSATSTSTTASTPAFNLTPSASSAAAASTPASTPAFSFKPSALSAASSPAPASAPAFSFQPAASSASFTSTSASTPAFSFKPPASSAATALTTASAPAFSVAPAASSAAAAPAPAPTPSFSFKPTISNAAASPTPASAPAFGFAAAAASGAAAAPASSAAAAPASAFSFKPPVATSAAPTPAPASAPAFGSFKPAASGAASASSVASASAFSFKPPASSAAPKTASASAPSFSFKPAATSASTSATPSPPRSTLPPKPLTSSATMSPVDKGMKLLEKVKFGEIDMSAAQRELEQLMQDVTPTKSPRTAQGPAVEKFKPVDTSLSSAVNLQSSPLPSWGSKLEEVRRARSTSAGEADGLKAIEDDMSSVIAEVKAMLEDVSNVTKIMTGEKFDDSMHGKTEMDYIKDSATSAKDTIGTLIGGSGQLRSSLNELWAANSADESLRSELESRISIACEALDENAAVEDTRELSPVLKEVQKNMQLDMRSVLEMAADLEASVERLEAAKREASRPRPKHVINSGLVSSSAGQPATSVQIASIMKAISTQSAVISAQTERLDQLLQSLQDDDIDIPSRVPEKKKPESKRLSSSPSASMSALKIMSEPLPLKTPVKTTLNEDDGSSDLESVIMARMASTRITTVQKEPTPTRVARVSPIKKPQPVAMSTPSPQPPASPPQAGFSADFLAKANKGYAAAQKALEDDLNKAAAPTPSAPAFSAPKPALSAASAPAMGFSADFLAKANAGYQKAQAALEEELAGDEPKVEAPTQTFSFGIPSTASSLPKKETEEKKAESIEPSTGGFSFGIPKVESKTDTKEDVPARTSAFSFGSTAASLPITPKDDGKSKESSASPEKATESPTMGFSAEFLAKANKGYAAAQKALEDDLAKATPPPGTPPAAAQVVQSESKSPFAALDSSSVPKFGIQPSQPAENSSADASTTTLTSGVSTSFGSFSFGGKTDEKPKDAESSSAATPSSPPAQPAPASSSAFGAPASSSSFGAPASSSAFGAPASSSAFGAPASSSSFGAPASSSAFGAPASSSSFGAPASSSAFGAPASSSAFGAPASSSSFGAPASSSAFGAPASSSSFGAPASSSSFGAPASSSAFGAPASSSSFGAPASSSAFGAPASSSAFGAPASSSSFGAPASSSAFGAPASSSAFGSKTSFGAATTTSSPAFGTPSAFGAAASTSSPAFGAPASPGGFGKSTSFGAAASTSSPAFGAPASPVGFGSQTGFGSAATTGGGFAAAAGKPSAFGAVTSSAGAFGQSSGFGTPSSPGFGASTQAGNVFGAASASPQSSGGFGSFASQPSGFGAAAASTGGFGSSSGFGQASSGGFGQVAASGFGQVSSGFGQAPSSGFGQPASGGFGQPASGGFGQPAAGGFGQASGFGAQPTSPSGFNTSNPAFTQMRR